jgi:hypothetical protein
MIDAMTDARLSAPIAPRSFTVEELLQQEAELLALWGDVALPELFPLGPVFTGKPKTYLETIRRMELWIGSMQLFRDTSHHQAAATGARALSELCLDVKDLAADADGSALMKFEAFPEVEHFRVSEKLVAFYRKTPGAIQLEDLPAREAYVDATARRDRIYETCRNLWRKDPAKDAVRGWPKHWTDQGSDRRARNHGPVFEEHHVLTYARLSLYLHSGAAGTSTGPEGEMAVMGLAHAMAVQSFLSALAVLAQQIPLPTLLQEMDAWAKRWHAVSRSLA